MDTKSYFKNVAKSVNYMVDDLLKTKYPATYNMKHLKGSISEANKEFREAELAARRAQINNLVKEESIPYDNDTMLMNLKSDFKTGKFYNKGRIKSYDDSKSTNAFERDFGQSLDIMNGSFNSINKSLAQQSKLNITVAQTQMRAQRHDMLFRESTAKRRHVQSMQLSSAINTNLINMVEFNNNKLAPFMNQSLTYYRDSMIEFRRTNSLLSEMRDYYKIVNNSAINPNTMDLKQTTMEKAFMGGFNAKNYTKLVRNNLKDVTNLFLNAKEVAADSGYGLMSSPISYIIKTAMTWFTPKEFNKSLDTLEKTMQGLPAAFMIGIMNMDKSPAFGRVLNNLANSKLGKKLKLDKTSNLQGGVAGILRSIFGISTDTEYHLDRINKDPMQFNGVTQKAITTVIPTLLGKIYTTLAGFEDDIVVDYNRGGKIKWASKKRQEIESQYTADAQRNMFDFNKEMMTRINQTNLSSKDRDRVLKEFKKTNNYLAKGGTLRFNDPNFAKEFAKVIDPQYVPYFISLFKTLPLNVLNALPFNQIMAQMSRSRLSRELERDSDLNGLAAAELFNEWDKNDIAEVDFTKKTTFGKFVKENEKYNKTRDGLKDIGSKARTTNISLLQHKVNLIKDIKDILIQGIIVYPMKRTPREVIQRKQSLRNMITNSERETIKEEVRQRDLAIKLGEDATKNDYDNLNDPGIGNIVAARIDPSKARLEPEKAIDDGTKHRGFKSYLQNLLNAPMRATAFMINGFSKMMNKLIYGNEKEGIGLLNELANQATEIKNKMKDWLLGKAEDIGGKVRNKWNESEIGKTVNSKIEQVRNWFTKSNEEVDENGNVIKKGTNFAAGFQEAWGNTKDYVKNGIIKPVKQFGLDLKDEFSGTIDSFKDVKKWLFGDEKQRGGLINRDFQNMFKGTGFNIKKSGGKVAGMAALGAIGGMFLGGPLAGAAIAGGASFINSSEKLKEKLFGNDEKGIEGLIPKDLVKAIPNIGKGVGIGLAGHLLLGNFLPGGPITASLVGALGGYMKTHGMLDKLFWGGERKDGSKFKGLFTRLGDFFYDHIGGYVQSFIQKQAAAFQHTIDRWLFIPIKHAIKPVGMAISKSFQWMGKKLVSMVDKTTGGAVSWIGKQFRKLAGGIFSLARWGVTQLFGAKMAKVRGLITLPGSLISGASNILAKAVMTKEQYAEYKANKKADIDRADATYADQKEANREWDQKFKEDKANGISWSDKHPMRKKEKAQPATNGTLVTATESIGQMMYKTNDETIKSIVNGNDSIVDNMDKSTDRIVNALKGEYNTPDNINKDKSNRKTISLSDIEAKGLITPKPDDLVGKDVVEQQKEEAAEKQASVLERIEINTANTSKGLLGFLKGDNKKGSSLWDTIKGIGSNLFGVLKNLGTVALVGFGIFRFLKYFNSNGGDLGDAAKDLAIDMGTSSRGLRTIRKGINFVGNTLKSAKNGIKAVTNFGGKVGANVANIFKGGNASDLTKQIAKGDTTLTHTVKEAVVDSASSVKNKLVTKLDDALKYLCKNKKIGKYIEPLYNGAKKAFPEIAEKVTKAAGKGMFRSLSKALVIAEIACYINDAVTGFADYRNILQLPADSPHDNVMAGICAVVRFLNGAVCFGLVPERWFVELILKFVGKGDELEKYQEEFNQNMQDAGFGDNVEAYNKYENPTFWTKVATAFGLSDTRRELVQNEIDKLQEQLNGLDPNSAEYKAIQEQIDKLNKTLNETSNTWYESLGNFFDNVFVNPIKKVTQTMNSWLDKFWGIDEINELEDTKDWKDVISYISDKYTIHGGADNGLIKGTSESGIDVGAFYSAYNDEVTKAIPAFASGEEKAKIYQEFYDNHKDEIESLYQEGVNAGAIKNSGGPAVRIDGKVATTIANAGGAIDIDGKSATVDYGIKTSSRRRPIDNYTRISSPYGWRDWDGDGKADEFHDGLDYAAPAGTPIYAADSGKAYVAKYGYNGGWGNHIRIKHNDGTETIYGHASKLNISEGQNVTKGQKIAEVGTTGRSTGNHLHFGAYKSVASGTPKYGTGIDTNTWLNGKSTSVSGPNTNKNTATQDSSVKTDAKATEIIDDENSSNDNILTKIMSELGNFFTASIMGRKYTPGSTDKSSDDNSGTPSSSSDSNPSFTQATNDDFLGRVSVKYETGSELGDASYVSRGNEWGDPGGISYGIPQFSTNTGSAQTFVNNIMAKYPVYKNYFSNVKPGSNAFGNAWKRAASERGDEFRALQLDSVYDNFYIPWKDKLKAQKGVDVDKDRALQETAYSMSVQHGPNSTKYFAGLNSSMDTNTILEKLFANRNNLAGYPTTKRWKNELSDMKSYVGKSPIGYSDSDYLNKYLKSDAKGGGPISENRAAMGGPEVKIGNPVDTFNNTMSEKLSKASNDIMELKQQSSGSGISLDIIEALLTKLVSNSDLLVTGVNSVGEVLTEAVNTAVAAANNSTNLSSNSQQVIATNNLGSNIFTTRVDKSINKTTDAMRSYISSLAKGN